MQGTRGFNLAEVMVALCLVTIALLALVSMQVYSLRAQTKTSEHYEASLQASSVLGEVEARLRDSFDQNVSVIRQPLAGTVFEYEVIQADEEVDLKRVEVRLYWKDRNGDQIYTLWTRFCREG